MRNVFKLSRLVKNQIPSTFIILSLCSVGIYYEDKVRAVRFQFNSFNPLSNELIDHKK